jgi:histidinol-phosphatase (PHP family)
MGGTGMYSLQNDIFHVHTYRCGHASSETDEDYVEAAMKLGAKSITFTDHAPFPNNPFTGRMVMEQLSEYIDTLKNIRRKYEGRMDIHIGLEIEYLPYYGGYYKNLKENKDIEVLMLGQHHYEVGDGIYSFQINCEKNELFKGLMEAQIEGIKTGYFNVIAHPDRCYRYCQNREWGIYQEIYAKELINAASDYNVILEKNFASMAGDNMFWEEFWKSVPCNAGIVFGYDAHSVAELRARRSQYY